VLLGYPSQHHGYRCLDRSTQKIIISRHVVFDESVFPFASNASPPSSTPTLQSYDFLQLEQPMLSMPFTAPIAGTSAAGARQPAAAARFYRFSYF
jgi:hypothetical protein